MSEIPTNEITKTEPEPASLVNSKDIEELVKKVIDHTAEERRLALEMYNRLTGDGEFDKISDVMYKGEVVYKMLELANKSTGELNKLLATIQRFASVKTESENLDKILSAEQIAGMLNVLDVLQVGPNKFTGNTVKKETIDAIRQVQKNYKDKDGVDVEFVDLDEPEK